MSRRRSRAVLAAAVTLGALSVGAPAYAQARQALHQAEEELPTAEELLAEIERLGPLVEAAAEEEAAVRERAELESRERAAAARVDSFTVGLVRVITPRNQRDRTRTLFREVWASRFSGIDASPTLESTWFTFQWDDDLVPIHVDGDERQIRLSARMTREIALERIRTTIATSLMYDLAVTGSKLGLWVGSSPLTHDEVRARAAYRSLATARSTATRSCLAGQLDGCVRSLGVGEADTPIGMLYTEEERRLLVETSYAGRSRALPAVVGECVDDRRYASCDDVLALAEPRSLAPASPGARAMLFAIALDRGGEGAWGRALERPEATPGEALAHVANEPIEDLVNAWFEELQRDRPQPHASLPARSGLTLLWTLLFAALAMRSTRWRLG